MGSNPRAARIGWSQRVNGGSGVGKFQASRRYRRAAAGALHTAALRESTVRRGIFVERHPPNEKALSGEDRCSF